MMLSKGLQCTRMTAVETCWRACSRPTCRLQPVVRTAPRHVPSKPPRTAAPAALLQVHTAVSTLPPTLSSRIASSDYGGVHAAISRPSRTIVAQRPLFSRTVVAAASAAGSAESSNNGNRKGKRGSGDENRALIAQIKELILDQERTLLMRKYGGALASDDKAASDIKAYVEKYSRLVRLEAEEDVERFARRFRFPAAESLWKDKETVKGLVGTENGDYLDQQLLCFSTSKEQGEDLPSHSLVRGDIVFVVPDEQSPDTADSANRYSGTIIEADARCIKVAFKRAPDVNAGQAKFRMDGAICDIAYKRTMAALGKMYDAPPASSTDSSSLLDFRGMLINQQKVSAPDNGASSSAGSESADMGVTPDIQFQPPPGSPTQGMPQEAVSWAQELLPDGRADPKALEQQKQRLEQECQALKQEMGIKVDSSQLAAIALSFLHRCMLLQGPPGTGKTATIVNTVRLLQHKFNYKPKILLCAQTNAAVDNLVELALEGGLDVLRVGEPSRATAAVQENTLKHLIQKAQQCDHNMQALLKRRQQLLLKWKSSTPAKRRQLDREVQTINNALYKHSLAATVEILRPASIVATTCLGAGGWELKGLEFGLLIVDEASQCHEPQMLNPIMLDPTRMMLVGDQQQLPPLVISDAASAGGLGVSLFERLMEQEGVPKVMLQYQYRMHPALSAAPSRIWYDDRLENGVTAAERELPAGAFADPGSPMKFVNVEGKEASVISRSLYNEEEVKAVWVVVEQLIATGIPCGDIGVVTPYAAQKDLLCKALEPLGGGVKMDIQTVDGFQGREKKVMVLSTVRANWRGDLGFTGQEQRMCVAFTRAQCGLVVVGNRRTLQQHAIWAELLSECEGGAAALD